MGDDAMPTYDCHATVARLYPYLDRELEPAEQAAVRAHLDECGPCADLFRFEAGVLTFLRRRLAATTAPDHLRARLARLARLAGTGQ